MKTFCIILAGSIASYILLLVALSLSPSSALYVACALTLAGAWAMDKVAG